MLKYILVFIKFVLPIVRNAVIEVTIQELDKLYSDDVPSRRRTYNNYGRRPRG